MARIDRVLGFLQQQKSRKGISAHQLAIELGIHRSDASADLNRLFKQGVVSKTGARPVVYRLTGSEGAGLPEVPEALHQGARDSFAEIVGYDGSIKAQVELAKAAIVYPPQGLHTLIFGESGVGKNLLAEAMWNFSKGKWQPEKGREIPFVQFCCADYAANEQLLLAQLFGYVKGAFTGASEDHEGVVDRAEGGILFLDEIHRLPSTGQELLFMLIDKGVYRRLGETRSERRAKVMIIGATSENITSSLLMTFRRRIPVQISLPRISERPIREKVNLIMHFVRQEAIRLGLPIRISGPTLRIFANYNCPANIGELRNDVLLCCAKSYLACSAGAAEELALERENIPQRIFPLVKRQTVLDAGINRLFEDGILIEPHGGPAQAESAAGYNLHIDFYGYVDRKMENYRQLGMEESLMARRVSQDLENYFESVAQVLAKESVSDIPVSIIEESVWAASRDLLNGAAAELQRSYGRNTVVALAWHLQQFKERVHSGRLIYNPHLLAIKSENPTAFAFVCKQAERLAGQLGSPIAPDEMGFITMFLVHGAEDMMKAKIGIVIAAHGRGTAQSMAEVANNLLGTDHIQAYDIPLNRSNVQTVEDLREVIRSADEGRGVILLVDMGFLVTMEDTLSRETDVEVAVLPNVTTALVLEAGRRVLTTEDALADAVDHIYNAYNEYVLTLRQRKSLTLPDGQGAVRKSILLTCASGQGVAEKVKEILQTSIPATKQMHLLTVGAVDEQEARLAAAENHVVLVIGSMDPRLPGMPFIHVSQLFTLEGIEQIKAELEKQQPEECPKADCRNTGDAAVYDLLSGQLSKFVKTLPAERVSDCCRLLVERIALRFFPEKIEQDAVIRIYLHAACMFDRVHTKEALQEPDWGQQMKKERAADFQYLKECVTEAGAYLGLEVPSGELCYFLSSLPDDGRSR